MKFGEYYRNAGREGQVFFVEGQNREDGLIRMMDLKNKVMCQYDSSTKRIQLTPKVWQPIEFERLTPTEEDVFKQYQLLRAKKQVELEHKIEPKAKKRREKFEAEVTKAVESGIKTIDRKLHKQKAGTSEKYTIMFPWHHWKWSSFYIEGRENFNEAVADRL